MKILVNAQPSPDTQAAFFPPSTRALLEQLGEVTYRVCTPEELRDTLPGYDVLFTGWGSPRLDEAMLEKADRLQVVAYYAGSIRGILSDGLQKRNIRLLCGNRVFAQSVAEGTVAYMLLAQRRLPYLVRRTAEDGWNTETSPLSLFGKTVGLVEYGMIAKEVIPLLQAFQSKVLVWSDWLTQEEADRRGVEKVSLDELMARSDIVSVHASLRPDTVGLISREKLAMMKDNALLVNTARGPIVDEAALAEELQAGRLRAVLDVYCKEPLPKDSPLRCENAILLPHKAGPTKDLYEEIVLSLVRDLYRLQKGETDLPSEVSYSYAANMTDETLRK